MFENFDFSILDNPEFKEDAVREELVVPILKRLGYSATGQNRILRSKPLVHPFVYIGTTKHKLSIIPDYILHVNDQRKWVLDAKSPFENVHFGKNVEQTFSYAIHKDVRVMHYGLCNGRHLTVFHVSRMDPVLDVPLSEIDGRWDEVNKLLCPIAFVDPERLDYRPDFGLSWLKLGGHGFTSIWFPALYVNFISKLADEAYTIVSNFEFEGSYCSCFDFNADTYRSLLGILPKDYSEQISRALSRQPYHQSFENNPPAVSIRARLSSFVHSNDRESYVPFDVTEFKPADLKDAIEGLYKLLTPES